MDAKHDRVIESRVRRLGEISDLAPGKTGRLTPHLRPGRYVLFCNQPGHYHDGMATELNNRSPVTPLRSLPPKWAQAVVDEANISASQMNR